MSSWPSVQSRCISRAAFLLRTKQISPLLQDANIRMNSAPPTRLYGLRKINRRYYNGHKVWYISPRERLKKKARQYILYFHGGSYSLGFLWIHWRFFSNISREASATVIAPDYPLTPSGDVDDLFQMVLPLYRQLCREHGAQNITIIGDSAGGGLALALAQVARDEGMDQPAELCLFAPWIDLSMSNREIDKIESRDPLLNRNGLSEAGKLYAGVHPLDYPRVSPLYGDCSGLAPIYIYTGDRDLLLPDCRRLEEKVLSSGGDIYMDEVPGMVHQGPLLLIPEARVIRREICQRIQKRR